MQSRNSQDPVFLSWGFGNSPCHSIHAAIPKTFTECQEGTGPAWCWPPMRQSPCLVKVSASSAAVDKPWAGGPGTVQTLPLKGCGHNGASGQRLGTGWA